MNITEIFADKVLKLKIQKELPELFYLAELECSRAGKIGMEVGSVREKVLIALLIYKFDIKNITTDKITEPEIDVKLSDNPISIKTITGNSFSGVKLIWTVDWDKVIEFSQTYRPACDILPVQIHWDAQGALYLIPRSIQENIIQKLGINQYLKLPKQSTNPRGVEISQEALKILVSNPQASSIPIFWKRNQINFDPYARWLEL
ncbi:ThaI family type II restriction endonuclease [Thermosynechococcaceae cyanobacterium BACA0444]|uniref:ThaI family type II restriction endonuclease n=1 Tax=Pseudocalidococcus azoricus BACA0444 TaxID=2918990 RepID=A0AAE4JY10_9CYAN|nr:ThaI family type II restriction endonuclease [Pseudocalidococcus azoricus]MDS3860504.1 ThaI family type II restriction endonuclease [Pseudocalidococcus azoricus BACA0444]